MTDPDSSELLLIAALSKSRWLHRYQPAPFHVTVDVATHTCLDASEGDNVVEVERIWRIKAVKLRGHQEK